MGELRVDRRDAETWMRAALDQAALASESEDVPVGAVVVDAAGAVIGVGRNERELTADPTAHAELVAMRAAAESRGNWNLSDVTLVVTLEPCAMCAGAVLAARIPRLVYGAWDEKAGAVGSVYDLLRDRRLPHRVDVLAGIEAEESAALLERFFAARR
jgi:tRNA(adenine34) deaminase